MEALLTPKKSQTEFRTPSRPHPSDENIGSVSNSTCKVRFKSPSNKTFTPLRNIDLNTLINVVEPQPMGFASPIQVKSRAPRRRIGSKPSSSSQENSLPTTASTSTTTNTTTSTTTNSEKDPSPLTPLQKRINSPKSPIVNENIFDT